MKNLILLILVSSTLLTGCYKVLNNIKLGDLPAETQIGANTFGCLINGKGFIPQTHFAVPPPDFLKAGYTAHYGIYDWQISIYATDNNNTPYTNVSLYIDTLGLRTGSTIVLHRDTSGHRSSADLRQFNHYYVVPPLAGELHILKYDVPGKILAGTFSFSAVDTTSGERAVITEGRFDVKLN